MTMLYISLALLLLSAALFSAEMFMPGFGVCGISGILLLVASAVITILFVPHGVIIVIAELAILILLGFALFDYVRKKQLHGKLILDDTLPGGEREIGSADYFLGKEGTTKTPLRPFGTVDFNGADVEVCSDGPYIPERSRVKVVDVSYSKITVKAVDTN